MDSGDRIRLIVLGGLETLRPDGQRLRFPTRHCGFVMAMLAATPDHRLRREAIAGCLWGERGEAQARASLRQTLHHLRKTLLDAGSAALEVDREAVSLRPPFLTCDLWELRHALSADPLAAGAPYKGEFLASCGRTDPAFDEWIASVRQGLSAEIGGALRAQAEREKLAGHQANLERAADLLLTLDPYDENAFRMRLEALAGQDRRGALRSAYSDFSDMVRKDLGTGPSAATSALYERLVEEPEHPDPNGQTGDPPVTSVSHEARLTVSVLSALPIIDSDDPEIIRDATAQARSAVEAASLPLEAEHLASAGDTVDVVFGAGALSESHAIDAVRCALRLASNGRDRFKGVGVVTGDIIATDQGPEPTSVGRLVARATELARESAASTVRVAAETARRAEGFFEFDPLPDADGYAVTGETSARNRFQARGAAEGIFVARESELAELSRAARRAREGDGRVVGIVGEAGIGKSRLVAEFLNSNEATAFQVLTLTAATQDKATPFGPLPDFLADWAGRPTSQSSLADALAETADREGLAAQDLTALRAIVGTSAPDDDWAVWDGPTRRRRIVALFRSIVEAACRKAPLILIVEDLHWLDGETEQLLHRLIDDLATQPLLLIATYRPEYAAAFVGRSVFHLIRLEPLTEKETGELVAALIGPDPSLAAVRRRVAERTGGIPLFVEESVNALAGSGALAGRPGRYESGTGSDRDDLPATIQDVLAARIAQLSVDARWLIQCASVFGFEVAETRLFSCGGLSAERSDEALRELLHAELLVRRRNGDANVLRFRHALIRDVTYSGLLAADRKRLHGDIYRLLQADSQPITREHCSALARHADRCGDNGAAAHWYERAGDLFAEISAYAQATDAYQRALDAIASGEQADRSTEIGIRLKLRPVLVPQGRFGAAIAQLEAAEDLLADQNDRQKSAGILISKSYIHSTGGQLTLAADEARHAARLTREGEQPAFEARLALGQALSLSGAWQETLAVLRPTIEFWEENRLERFGHTGTRSVWCHGHLAHALAIHGDFETAAQHSARAGQIATETGRPLDRVFADHRHGEILLLSGRIQEAIALLENAFAVTDGEAEDAPIFRTWFACDLAPAYLAAGRLDDAANILAVQHESARRMELRQFGAWIVLRKAQLALAEGDLEAAGALAEDAMDQARRMGDLLLEPTALRIGGVAGRAQGHAGVSLEEARSLCKVRGFAPEHAACLSALTGSTDRR